MEHPGAAPLGGASRLRSALEAWAAEAAVDVAREARRRARALTDQAREEATLAGVLLDLAERGDAVVVETTGGRQHRGWVELLGDDVVILGLDPRGVALVRQRSVAEVRTAPGSAAVTGDRTVVLDVPWATALTVLAEDRPRVHAGLVGGGRSAGELVAVGLDVVTLRREGDGGRSYLPLDAVQDVVVDDVTVTAAFR